MHKILHMGSQSSSSAVPRVLQFNALHKILHMESQLSSSAVQQFGTCTRYCIWDTVHTGYFGTPKQGGSNGQITPKPRGTMAPRRQTPSPTPYCAKQQHQLLSAYVDTSGTKFFIDKSTPMGMCFCMQLNLMCDFRL
jgi:hypothetical protein